MWVIIRFFGLLLFWNQWLKFKHWIYEKRAANKVKINDREIYEIVNNRKILSSSTYICTPLKRASQFRIHQETKWDQLFKGFGLVSEFETGDRDFDSLAFIESDAKALVKEIAGSKRAKDIILEILETEDARISCDKEWLEIQLRGKKESTDRLTVLLVELADWLDEVPSKTYSLFRDSFHYKILGAEFVFTGIAFYGISSLAWYFFQNDLLETNLLTSKAIKLSVFLGLILLAFNFYLLRGSSRGHRLVYENMLYIVIGVPLASFFLVSDANKSWDRKKSMYYDLPVTKTTETRYSDNWWFLSPRRSRYYYGYRKTYYYLTASLSSLGLRGSKKVSVNQSVYLSAPDTMKVEVGQGYFNQKYIKNMIWY